MLRVYQSNRLEALVTLLSKQIQLNPIENLFEPDTILVQSPGMSQWLKLEIANQNGIAANLAFPLPSSFIWRLYQTVLNDVPVSSPFNKDRMTWKLYQLLPEVLNDEEFEHILRYLQVGQNKETQGDKSAAFAELRRFLLAEKIADVFDNYLMYRPHWLVHWQEGFDDLPDEVENEITKWQAILWRRVFSYTLENNSDITPQSPLHRADMQAQFLHKLKHSSPELVRSWLPNRLFVFGISTLPAAQLEVLMAISEHIDIDIMWLNPCSFYWGDIISDKTKARLSQKQQQVYDINHDAGLNSFVSGNPLLAGLGKVGRDYLEVLHQANIEFVDLFIEPTKPTDSVLQMMQNDILNLQFRQSQSPLSPKQILTDKGKTEWLINDDSIRIHTCHNAVRELEVLRDQLLNWFEQDPELEPKDILIMMPDINQYAPYIDSIFTKQKGDDATYIPYTIADRSGVEQHPLLGTFVELIGLPISRFSVNEILDILEVPVVMQRFNLCSQEIALLKHWIGECQIRWAKDAKQKSDWGLPELDLNTWLYGLQRMLLGVSNGDDELWYDILSYSNIEGLNTQILGKFLDFFSLLNEVRTLLEKKYTLHHWHRLLNQLVDKLFVAEETEQNSPEDDVAVLRIRDGLQNILLYENNADFQGEINFLVIQRVLNKEFNESGVTQRFLAGKMNFCTLMPMRSVPFKVIAILGLNEGDYPRRVEPISFDLIGKLSPRKGDRSRKLDDRYLFLEALISVREKLHLSYIGQSQKTNEAQVPSIILDEFKEYLSQSYIVDNNSSAKDLLDQIIVRHKLQPFDPVYYSADMHKTPYFTYNNRWLDMVRKATESPAGKQSEIVSLTSKDRSELDVDPWFELKGSETEVFDQLDDPVDLDAVIEFWRHPIRYFYRKILDVNLDLYTEELDEFEVFQHDGLQRYQHTNEILQQTLKGETDSYDKHLRSGAYPANSWGKSLLSSYVEQNQKLKNTIEAVCRTNDPQAFHFDQGSLHLDLDIGDRELRADVTVSSVNGVYLTIRNGKLRPVDQLAGWLVHLCLNSALGSTPSYVLTNDDKLLYMPGMQQDEAKAKLSLWLLPFFRVNQRKELLIWHIDPALSWMTSVSKGESSYLQQKALEKEVQPDGFRRTLADDQYANKHLQNASSFGPAFFDVTETLIQQWMDVAVLDKTQKILKLIAQSRD